MPTHTASLHSVKRPKLEAPDKVVDGIDGKIRCLPSPSHLALTGLQEEESVSWRACWQVGRPGQDPFVSENPVHRARPRVVPHGTGGDGEGGWCGRNVHTTHCSLRLCVRLEKRKAFRSANILLKRGTQHHTLMFVVFLLITLLTCTGICASFADLSV